MLKNNEGFKFGITEIFKSVQFEGAFAGQCAWFVRFAGCNFNCSFCDTPQRYDVREKLTAQEIWERINEGDTPHVVLTGGEPTLQPLEDLVDYFDNKYFCGVVTVETNGTNINRLKLLRQLDVYITFSPKVGTEMQPADQLEPYMEVINRKLWDEIKFVQNTIPTKLLDAIIRASFCGAVFIQPQATVPVSFPEYKDGITTTRPEGLDCSWRDCFEFVKQHPQIKMSVQTHKLLGFQ